MKIVEINAYEILASGGYPTVECKVRLESGVIGIASVPYGASAGSHEATVLNDGDENRYKGKGALKAVNNINATIAPELIGMDPSEQRLVDEKMISMDGTENKANLGGNAILAVSMAVADAARRELNKPLYRHIADTFQTGVDFSKLPNPMVVAIEGGKHANNSTDMQEYCITGVSNEGPTENIRKALETYHVLETILEEKGYSTNVGNEGAFAPEGITSNEIPFNLIVEAIQKAGYQQRTELGISIDPAASEFYQDGMYNLKVENRSLNAGELISMYDEWFQKYPIITVEDLLHEDDWDNWVILKQVCDKYQIPLLGDDLTVTNSKRLQKGIEMNALSAILIKLNQAGSLTETVDTCMLAKKHNFITVVSHRGGGETNDTGMVDLAVAVGSAFIKVGPTRGERVSKYNRLMEIERELG